MRKRLIICAIALLGGLLVLALPPSWSPLLTPLLGLVIGLLLKGKWIIICPLIGWMMVSPLGGLLGMAIILGGVLFLSLGIIWVMILEFRDVLTDFRDDLTARD